MTQTIIFEKDGYKKIENLMREYGCRKFLLVCGNSFKKSYVMDFFERMGIPFTVFSGFSPNPDYEEVCEGVTLFNREKCDVIVAAGGGSAIDVAKCIKLFCKMDSDRCFLDQEFSDTKIPLIAIPTTAGTGSESTRFSVIYKDGEKQSVHHESIVPNAAILESDFLRTLPDYQKKCTLMDAFCQAIESWWSVHSTEESIGYAKEAVRLIVKNGDEYILGDSEKVLEDIMLASNLAGRAINITATTAPHAMCYKITTVYDFAHGHSVALCLPRVLEFMIENLNNCVDARGKEYLLAVLEDISSALGVDSPKAMVTYWDDLLEKYGLNSPVSSNKTAEIEILSKAVNLERLKNNPVELTDYALRDMYGRILKDAT